MNKIGIIILVAVLLSGCATPLDRNTGAYTLTPKARETYQAFLDQALRLTPGLADEEIIALLPQAPAFPITSRINNDTSGVAMMFNPHYSIVTKRNVYIYVSHQYALLRKIPLRDVEGVEMDTRTWSPADMTNDMAEKFLVRMIQKDVVTDGVVLLYQSQKWFLMTATPFRVVNTNEKYEVDPGDYELGTSDFSKRNAINLVGEISKAVAVAQGVAE